VIALIAVVAGSLFCGPRALGQAPPKGPGPEIISSNDPFSNEQIGLIKAWAEYWAGRIADEQSTPEDVELARGQIVEKLSALYRPSPAFRYEYAKVLAPVLDPVVRTGNLHAAINATRVLGEVTGPRALSVLLGQLDGNPGRWQVRLWAAIGTRNNLQSGILEPRTVTDAVRKLTDSAKNETDPLILRYKLEAIAAADQPQLGAADLQTVRLKLVDAINDAINRIADDPKAPPAMLDAVRAATVKLRNTFIGGKLTVAEQKEIGEKIGPGLGKVLAIANANWQTAQADESTARLYGNFVQVCEEFLKRIDGYVRSPDQTPRTQLVSSWAGKQKEQFDAAAKQWSDVLAKPPYKP
jgi:hypothetical protein